MKEHRDRAAEEALRGVRALRPVVLGEVTDRCEHTRRMAIALSSLERVAWLMASAGAPIRPDYAD